MFVRKGKGNLF